MIVAKARLPSLFRKNEFPDRGLKHWRNVQVFSRIWGVHCGSDIIAPQFIA